MPIVHTTSQKLKASRNTEKKLKKSRNAEKNLMQQITNLREERACDKSEIETLKRMLEEKEKMLEETQKSLKLVTQQKSSLNNQLERRRSHLRLLPFHIKEQAVIPRALYVAMINAWELNGDYRSLGCCAVVLFCFLWRRCLDLLPPHKFLQFIGEHQECFRIMEDKLLLKQDFNNCMAKMEDILDLIMVPFMIGQLWGETFNIIRNDVQGSGDENDRWFLVHIPSIDMNPPGSPLRFVTPGPAHVFICFATRNSVASGGSYGIWGRWRYTLYDQKKREQINPSDKRLQWSGKFVNTWRIVFNSQSVPGPVGSASDKHSWRLEAPVTKLSTGTEPVSDDATEPWDSD